MKTTKAVLGLVSAAAVGGLLMAVNFAAATHPIQNVRETEGSRVGDPRSAAQSQSTAAIVQNTGFEADIPDGAWEVGFSICGSTFAGCAGPPLSTTLCPEPNGNCCITDPNPGNSWYMSISQQHCNEPHIDNLNPATGEQHMRISADPGGGNPPGCTGFSGACRQYSRMPDIFTGLAQPTTIDFDLAMGQNPGVPPFGSNFIYWALAEAPGPGLTQRIYIYGDYGVVSVLDWTIGAYAYMNAVMTGNGAYDHFRIANDPCLGTVDYYFNDMVTPVYSHVIHANNGTHQSSAIFQGNNVGSTWDLDNVAITRFEACPTVCGDGTVEGGEQCEPGVAGPCPDGRCVAAGLPDECTCTPICTLAAPCELVNGENGPYAGPCDPNFGCIFLYAGDTESVAIDLCGSTGGDSRILFWGSAGGGVCTDLVTPCNSTADCPVPETCAFDDGNANDDCCDPASGACGSFGNGSTANASCYNLVGDPNYEACTCWDIPEQYDPLFLAQVIQGGAAPGLGANILVTISKKAVCGGPVLGSCCDTNGADAGTCVDNVRVEDCPQPGHSFDLAKCADLLCVCIPDCTGRVCGDDGCGGSCGDCDDDDACNGVETCDAAGQCVAGTPLVCNDGNACNGVETCNPSSGCVNGQPLFCDDGLFCNGLETCNPSSGCVPSTDPCDSTPTPSNCDEATDTCIPKFVPIPTVSEWGLVVMALLLLAGAKVYFGRRQAVA